MSIMKNKAVVKLELPDAKSKKAAKKALVDIEGFSSLTLDLEKSTLVVIGDMDPTLVVYKLRKYVSAYLVTFGPEKDEGKSQKNNSGGGTSTRSHRHRHRRSSDPFLGLPIMFSGPPNHGIGPSGYGYPYHYC